MQAEERAEDRGEFEPLDGESRKRKRGAEKLRSLISNKVGALMEKSLKDRGFIAEKGFKKLICHFAEMLEKRGWQSLGEHKEPSCAVLVKEFFVNMVKEEGKKVYVRGQWIDFSDES